MIYLIVGHRGTGKTSLLRALKGQAPEWRVFDLDTVIERLVGQSVSEIFASQGEAAFRQLERIHLEKLVNKYQDQSSDTYIALGAGFAGVMPAGTRVIWLRRPTDASGRLFLNRPRLSSHQSSYDEYHALFDERQKRYGDWAHEILERQEGLDESLSLGDQLFFGLSEVFVGGVVTLLPHMLRSEKLAHQYLKKRLPWRDVLFEIRDDLLSSEQINWVCEVIPYSRRLAALRSSNQVGLARSMASVWDWALELGRPPEGEDPPIISLHDRRGKGFGEVLDHFTEVGRQWRLSVLKLAVEVTTLEELEQGHEWWAEDPHRRCFLPRSIDGRWKWYRQLFGKNMAFGFWREGEGSAPDQPTLSEWLSTPDQWAGFAAVIGDPVLHSWTPVEQYQFFAHRSMPVVPIRITEEEFTSDVLDFFKELGLKAAAVTSPLKVKLRSMVYQRTAKVENLGAANTLILNSKGDWVVENTDLEGLRELVKGIAPQSAVAVWGGGGTKGVLEEIVPQARFFSARRGAVEAQTDLADFLPDVVIWAVGRNRQTPAGWPPSEWKPRLVIDLNYTEDSPGLEYAERAGCPYESGLNMFRVQADFQRQFWESQGL